MIIYLLQSTASWIHQRWLRAFLQKRRSPEAGPAAEIAALPIILNPAMRWQTVPESRAVEERYRLLPGDLGRTPTALRIRGVSYQGVEQVRLVLHFAETRKALALSTTQCRDLIRSTGSGNVADWLDRTVLLRVDGADGNETIRIDGHEPANVHPSIQSIDLRNMLKRFASKGP